MVRAIKRIVGTVLVLVIIFAVAAVLLLSNGFATKAGDPLADVKNGVVNTVIDATGMKTRLDQSVRKTASEAAAKWGIPQSMVDGVVDQVDITEWKVTSLPDGVTQQGTYSFNLDDTTAQITTYDDPSVVTLNIYGQTVTMEAPESAQGFVSLLNALPEGALYSLEQGHTSA